jgi:hypothetical protein
MGKADGLGRHYHDYDGKDLVDCKNRADAPIILTIMRNGTEPLLVGTVEETGLAPAAA